MGEENDAFRKTIFFSPFLSKSEMIGSGYQNRAFYIIQREFCHRLNIAPCIISVMENRLKELRKAKGLSQEELGKAFGVSRLAYAHWESGKFDPDLETLVKLADYFGTSIDYIYKHDTQPTFSPEERKILFEAAEIIEKHR